MVDIGSLKIETPKNLDSIFSLDCFKYNEMKALFKQIFEYLTKVGLKFGDIDKYLQSIPDFSTLQNKLKDLEKRIKELDAKVSKNEKDFNDKIEKMLERINNVKEDLEKSDSDLERRIDAL